MEKVLGIDLGTNSIGLTLREDNEFSWYGVYTFKKGVGEGKTGEFSYAAERTKHRSSRRLYNARRYRKWETLKVLIDNDYCPLGKDNLSKWKHFEKGIGRLFPIDDIAFSRWIKLDFDNDDIPDMTSPYQLRKLLISEKLELSIPENRYKVGRALYHIAQRRGFKSSRKSGINEKTAVFKGSTETKTIGRNEYESLIAEKGSLGAAFAYMEEAGIRVRNRYTLRSDYQQEVMKIIDIQQVDDKIFVEDIQKAIFFQRPLRSQKGLIGKCTLEPQKSRCPSSHPNFEEYRAWSFINNIKFRENENADFKTIPLELKEKIFHEKFFFKSKREFKFFEIRKFINENGGKYWELNYSNKMDDISVPSCYVSARLKSVFGEDWRSFRKTIERIDKRNRKETITYTIDDIWHILFSFEDEENFTELITKSLGLEENQIKELITLFNAFPVGYANLSLKAINNILPFLREGLIYSEAVIIAKVPEIVGKKLFIENKFILLSAIKSEIDSNRHEKIITSIVNNLIFKYYSSDYNERFAWKNFAYKLDGSDHEDIEKYALEYFGRATWTERMSKNDRHKIISDVARKYQEFFADEKREHIKPPHLVNQIKVFLQSNFEIDDKMINKIYHPSQIDIYPRTEDQQFLKSPKTAAFKNPMAYKSLYKLRDVINYLIGSERIDKETRIVVEIARELNDSNKRWAIETYQRKREVENLVFKATISELTKDSNFRGNANPDSNDDINKLRLWAEQVENFDEVTKAMEEIEKDKSISDKDIEKYRLWKEQECRCIYTGKVINLTDLFDQNRIDFEHTIPRSKSFDNSLTNLTVCYADYNRNVKQNKLPVDLPNYESEALGYSPIEPRLKSWENKVIDLEKQIDFWRSKVKYTLDKDAKDNAIRQRHLRQMDLDYWKNKLDRFTRNEVPQGFVNSQLIDTQIITKYAFHYLKTVFDKVDVIKGSNTAQFRKIYGIQSKIEKKDRQKHYHHAIDAAVLTLIPSAKNREEILKKAYLYEESPGNYNKQYHEKPFPSFTHSMIESIQKNILINNIPDKDRTLTPSKRIVRKRGRIVWIDKNKNIPKIAQGNSIRGELHLQTYYGKIKIAAKENSGSLKRDEKGRVIYNQVNGKDEVWMVIRVFVTDNKFNADNIVDEKLRNHIKEQLKVKKVTELVDFNNKPIRHIRCRVKSGRGYMNSENVTIVKEQTYKSTKDYKNFIYADSGENYLFGLYENENGRSIVPINVFESALYKNIIDNTDIKELFKCKDPIYIGRGKNKTEATLKHIFTIGQKVLFFEKGIEELDDLDTPETSRRLYYVKNLADAKQGLIRFQHHLDARDDKQLLADFPEKDYGKQGLNGFSKFTRNFVAPRLLLSPSNFNFIIEGKDFEMRLDGTIILL
jgi:CRISPR-associated endonuclease Csn1